MGTQILNDIHKDIKQLVTAITSYEEHEEGFRICEKFCLSNIKHHRYLSVASSTTKEAIKEITAKFSIHGKYKVATKFQELVDTFLSSFDFEQHPQYDLEWYLLTFLLELSKETHTSNLESLTSIRGECTFNATAGVKNDITEEIDWAEYLKEGQEEFFCDYKSDTESEWSDDLDEENVDGSTEQEAAKDSAEEDNKIVCLGVARNNFDKLSEALVEEFESKRWLSSNVQNTWWNELTWRKYPVDSKFCDAHLCEIWCKAREGNLYTLGTLSEYQVCRELMWMFHVQTQMLVFQQNSNRNFSICPNVSVPSLTIVAFNSILSQYCKCFSMMYKIEQFGSDLYSKEKTLKKPPLTYEAYYAAIKYHLEKIKLAMIEIEIKLMKQDDCNTILKLSRLLQDYIHVITVLFEIHERAVLDWKLHPNWVCATKLLSSIYFEIQNSHSIKKANICVDIYLSTLTVYLNIIDTWLGEGRLEDWRDEFMIVRLPAAELPKSNERYEVFTVRFLDEICKKDSILQFLMKKVQHMGQSVELLVSLDRITDIWKINVGIDEQRRSLVNVFFEKFEKEILKYSTPKSKELCSMSNCEVDGINEGAYDTDMEERVIAQFTECNNPFFIKALEQFIPSSMIKKDIVDAGSAINDSSQILSRNIFEKLQAMEYILPFRKILESSLSEILISRYNNASTLVKDIMIQEYKLEMHLSFMRSIYMMEAGHIMSQFYQTLFQEIETNQMWSNSYYLSCMLCEVLSQEWPDFSSRWSIVVQDTMTRQVLSAVDNISLHYTVGWPMNIMLTEKTLEKYNEIFRFQLKLKWALWTLNNLRFTDLESSKTIYQQNMLEQFQVRRLESLRFWLLHAIGSIHAYLSGHVLQNFGLALQKALKEADSLDVIISAHNEYLRKVHEHCLLTKEFEDLMATINNLIHMCNDVRKRWVSKNIMFATDELGALEASYIKYHIYLAVALHNAVENKDANYYDLISQNSVDLSENIYKEKGSAVQYLNNLARSLLTEVAYQYLPPSGLPVSIPRMVHVRNWYKRGFDFGSSSNEMILHQYEQTFSYLRWYRHEEYFILLNTSSYFVCQEMKNFIDSIECFETNLI